jgi:protein DGCR14
MLFLFIKKKKKYQESLMIENGDSKKERDDVTKSLDSWTYTSKNSLMYIPEGVALSDQEIIENSKKTRIINHANTRFTSEALKSIVNKPNSSNDPKQLVLGQHINVITKIGIDGKEAVKETPSVKGYKFVEPSPSPMPGRFAGDESPMMIWGEIESTPFRLDPSSTPGKFSGGPEFKIPDIPEREKLALGLEEQANAARRKKKDEALKMMQRNLASPSRNSPSLSEKYNNMSPAAQRLLSSKLKSTITTPSPLVKTKISTPSPFSAKSSTINSPFLTPTSGSKTSAESIKLNLKRNAAAASDSLTDNLLKLPKTS